jgi:hypothetical protein
MTWSKRIRQTHRWLSIAFTVSIIIATIAVAAQEEPAAFAIYLPLLPLFLLLFSGLYLFALPYATNRRRTQNLT